MESPPSGIDRIYRKREEVSNFAAYQEAEGARPYKDRALQGGQSHSPYFFFSTKPISRAVPS